MSEDRHDWLRRVLSDCEYYAAANELPSVSRGLQFTIAMFEMEKQQGRAESAAKPDRGATIRVIR